MGGGKWGDEDNTHIISRYSKPAKWSITGDHSQVPSERLHHLEVIWVIKHPVLPSFQNFCIACFSARPPRLPLSSAQLWRQQFHLPLLSLHPEPFPQATYYQHRTSKSPRGKVFLCDSAWTQTRISRRPLPRNSGPVRWATVKLCLQQALSWTYYLLEDLRHSSVYLLLT